MKIVADDKIPFLKGILEPFAEVVYLPGQKIDKLILKNADALLIRTRTKCNENLLNGTNVRFIGTATIGYDHIDTQYCKNNSITWTNAPGCNSSSVQQYIAAALLNVSAHYKFRLKDKTIGIIGVGNVGSKVENFAHSMDMRVLLNDPPRARAEGNDKFQSLDTVLAESDIITVHVPLNVGANDHTFHLFNEDTFRKIGKKAWFLNSSRGEVVDTSSLKRSLKKGGLAGAVVDVWDNEPAIDLELMHQAFISTPHIAGYSTDGKANGTAMVVNALSRHFSLPLLNWYPKQVPLPVEPEILIECRNKNEDEIIREAVTHTYNINEDDAKLRMNPSDFEKQRGDYPLRREFTAYKVNLNGGNEKIRSMLLAIGFRINR